MVQHCIYGVDRNPLAVQLCRTALWIEAVEPGRPLTFLDPHVQLGDSLIGILDPTIMKDGIPDGAYKPLIGDDAGTCTELRKRNKQTSDSVQGDLFDKDSLATMASHQAVVHDLSEDTIADLNNKQSAWIQSLQEAGHVREELRANFFVTGFYCQKTPKTKEAVPTREDLNRLVRGMSISSKVANQSVRLASQHKYLHWHVRFAEVMNRGGFDVVLGNPPWERIKLQEKEFFSARSQKISSAPNKAARDRLIRALSQPDSPEADKVLHRTFIEAKRSAEAASRYMRHSGRFPLTSFGDINTYAVFAETCLGILRPKGRAGIIVPTGIATDSSAQRFFQNLIEGQRLASLFDFENREGIFQGVHRSYKFSLLTLAGKVERPKYLFFATSVENLRSEQRRFELTREEIRLLNPNTRTAPTFRSKADSDLIKGIYSRVPVLVNESRGKAGNPWGIRFTTMFHMSNDSQLFRTWQQLESLGSRLEGGNWVGPDGEVWMPLVEAKMIHQFDHRWATFERDGKTSRLVTEAEKMDPDFVPIPRYWVPEHEVSRRIEALMTGDGRRETGDGRRETGDGRRETGDGRRETGDGRRETGDGRRETGDGRRETGDGRRETGDGRRETGDQVPQDTTSRYASSPERWTLEQQSARLRRRQGLETAHRRFGSRVGPERQVGYERNQSENSNHVRCQSRRTRKQQCSHRPPRWACVARKLARGTDSRTTIMSVCSESGMSDSTSIINLTDAEAEVLMASVMSSFVFDFCTRNAIGGANLNFFIIKQLPVPPPSDFLQSLDSRFSYKEFIIPRSLELIYTAWDLQPFAQALRFEGKPFEWDTERRFLLRCELDSAFFHLYGLRDDEINHVMDSFTIIRSDEENKFGEYRTKRVILEIYREMDRARRNGQEYSTRLNPGPIKIK